MPIVAMHIYYNTPSQCFHVFKIMIFVENKTSFAMEMHRL